MAAIITRRWKRPPQYRAYLDQSHPLARGLLANNSVALIFSPAYGGIGDPFCYLNLAVSCSSATGHFVDGSYGLAWDVSRASAQKIATATNNFGAYPSGTIVWRCTSRDTFNSAWNRLHWTQYDGGTPEFGAQIFTDNNWYVGWSGTTDTRVTLAATAANAPQNVATTYAFTWDTTSRFYQNGVLLGTNGSAPATSDLFHVMTLGQDPTGIAGGGFDGNYEFFYAFNPALTEAELAAIFDNPYQILRSRARRLYFAPPSVATAVFNPLSGRGGSAAQPLVLH